jgi:DNA-binding transcriptional regulator YiaG
MPTIAQTLNDEVRRLARKEIKAALTDTQKRTQALKKTVSDLKKRVAQLERENKALSTRIGRTQGSAPTAPTDEQKARITAKGIRSLRRKWGFTREQFAKVLSVSPQSIYQWESKEGALNLRSAAREAYLGVRGFGAREAKEKLEEMGKSRGRKAKK